MNTRRFELTSEGYRQAEAWLREIGAWDYVSAHGFSTDGFSITETANAMWRGDIPMSPRPPSREQTPE